MSASRLSGITPPRLVNPIVERMPTSAWCDEGPRIELPVSLPRPDGAEARGDGRGRAAARSGRDAIERVGVLRVSGKNRAERFVRRERPLGHVRLGQDDGARGFDLRHLKRVLVRDEAGERQRSVGALQADGLEVVLHDHRDAVQRSGQSALRESTVELIGLPRRLGVGHDDGVDAPDRSCRRSRSAGDIDRPASGRSVAPACIAA